MRRTLSVRRWLRWVMWLPLLSVYATGTCISDAIRDVADGLNDAANTIDGENGGDLDRLLEDLNGLFD